MKKGIIAILLIVITVVICSCSKEGGNQNNILGHWVVVNLKGEYFDGSGTLLHSYEEEGNGSSIEFASDGSMIMVDHGETTKGTFTLQDNTLTLYLSNSEIVTWSIEQLTSSSLSLKMEIRDQHYFIYDEFGCAIAEADDGVFIKSLQLERSSK